MTIKAIKLFFANALIVFLVLLDHLTKLKMKNEEPIIFNKYFSLTYSENTGIAFGIPIPHILLLAMTVLLLAAFIYFVVKELKMNSYLTITAISLIIAGGIGNFIDRILYGYVIDFIQIWKYPTFNIADILIVVGVLMIIAFYGRIKGTKIKK